MGALPNRRFAVQTVFWVALLPFKQKYLIISGQQATSDDLNLGWVSLGLRSAHKLPVPRNTSQKIFSFAEVKCSTVLRKGQLLHLSSRHNENFWIQECFQMIKYFPGQISIRAPYIAAASLIFNYATKSRPVFLDGSFNRRRYIFEHGGIHNASESATDPLTIFSFNRLLWRHVHYNSQVDQRSPTVKQ